MRSVVGLTVAALVALPLAACAKDPEGLPPSTQNGSGDSSSSSSSPTSAADPELEVVKERALNFENTQYLIATNRDKALDDISLVARGEASGWAKSTLQQFRAEGMTASGKVTTRGVKAKHLKEGTRPRAQVQLCLDVSDYVIKDAKGKKIKQPSATSIETRTLEQWGDTWYVTKVDTRNTDC